MEINRVTTLEEVAIIERMAKEIIPEHYGSFLPIEHVLYFIETYQTAIAIKNQLEKGFEYYLVQENNEPLAYAAIEIKEKSLLLSKIYTYKSFRGKGIGNALMQKIENRARELGVNAIELVVVKLNITALGYYKRKGFSIAKEISTTYTNGYVVDEYIMTKKID